MAAEDKCTVNSSDHWTARELERILITTDSSHPCFDLLAEFAKHLGGAINA
jgi:hypothetical protein